MPAITENILLITVTLVNISSLVCWKVLNTVSEKREGERDDLN